MKGVGMQTNSERNDGRATAACLAVLIVLVWSGVCAAEVLNPSFEVTYDGLPWPRPLPLSWGRVDHPAFNSYCTGAWYTEGERSASLFSRFGKSFNPGDYQGFNQLVDLTDVGAVVFDVYLAAYPEGEFEHFEASFFVDGAPLWSRRVGGEHREQKVNVSHLSGWHRIELRNTAVEAGTFNAAYWTYWDNVQLVEGASTIPAFIDLDPDTLNRASNGKWITCYIELEPAYDARDIVEASVTLEGTIPAHVVGEEGDGNIVDHDADGISECMVKFDRAAVQAIVAPPEATLTVQGVLTDGTVFEGTDTIRVIDQGGGKRK